MYCTLCALWFFWTLFTLWISCTLCWEFKFYLSLISTLQLHKKYLAASTILAKSQNRWIFYLDILQIQLPPLHPTPLLPLPFQFVSNSPIKLSFIRKIAFRKKLKIKKIVSFYFFVCDFYFFYYSIMFLKWGFVYKVMFCLQSEVSFTKTKWGFLYKAKFYLQSKVFVYKVRFCSQSEVLFPKWGFVYSLRFCLQREVLFTKWGFVYKVMFCLQI